MGSGSDRLVVMVGPGPYKLSKEVITEGKSLSM